MTSKPEWKARKGEDQSSYFWDSLIEDLIREFVPDLVPDPFGLLRDPRGEGEKVVVGPIDIGLLRAERSRRAGHDMRAHLRTEVHDYLGQTRFAAAGEHPLTADSIRSRISDAQRRRGEDR